MLLSVGYGQHIDADAAPQVTRSRLATCLVRFAREVLGTEPLTVQGLTAGADFLRDATILEPDLESAWRLLLDTAILTEQDERIDQVLPRIVSLSPASSTQRLLRLWRAVGEAHRLDEKSSMIDRLIDPENRSIVGDTVASRLALRLALLHRQAGNSDLFYHYLMRANALDPANQEAALILAGVEQHLLQSDPSEWAGVLLNLYRINPTDSQIAAELGMLLLHHGAYESAARMLGIARDVERESGRDAGVDYDADYLLALWASGQTVEAAELVLERHQRLNSMFRQVVKQGDGPRQSTLELASLVAPLPPKLATIECLMAMDNDDPLVLADALGEAERAANDLDRLRESDGVESGPRAQNLKRLLWLLVVLDGPSGSIEDVVHRINALSPLDSTELAMLGAATNPDMPIDQVESGLAKAAESSVVASLILAQRLEQAGHQRSAAKVLLAAWERDPGSMLGVLAGKRLAGLLGVELPMSPVAASMSSRVESLPTRFDRLAEEPSLAVTLRATPRDLVVQPFEPVLLDIELANHTPEPLEIGPNGPIEDLLLVQPSVDVPYADVSQGPPVFIDLARELVLEPHGEVNVALDLRTTWVGSVLDSRPLNGAVVDAEVFLNPRVATSPTSFAPVPQSGPLGSKVESREIRIDGVRTNSAWVDAAIAQLKEAPSSQDTESIALLAFVLSEQNASEGATDVSPSQAVDIAAAIAESWPHLHVVSQAWLTAIMPMSDPLRAVWSLVEGSTEPLIQRIHLMRVVSNFADPGRSLAEPVVVAGLRSGVAEVRVLSEWIEATLQLQAEDRFGNQSDDSTSP